MYGVSKITSEQDVMLITFTDINCKTNYPAQVLTAFAENKIVVDMISQTAPKASTMNFNFTVSNKYFDIVMKTIANLKNKTDKIAPMISSGFTKINLFGEDMVTSCGVGAKALTALSQNDISIMLITTSDLDISVLVRVEDEDTALAALQKEFNI